MPGCSKDVQGRIDHLFAKQLSVLTVAQARDAGMTPPQIRWAHESGEWVRLFRSAYRRAGTPERADGLLLAACLVTGGQASHESAAWWWKLTPGEPPSLPTVTVPRSSRAGRAGMVTHRTTGQRFARPLVRDMPCTDARRTIVDLASVADDLVLTEAIDRGLARKFFDVGDLLAELNYLKGRAQPGAAALRRSLLLRHSGSPNPSVLESLMLRLLARAGIHPLRCEQRVNVPGGHYRLDFVLLEGLALEVDGYFPHFRPEAHDNDHWRRNELFLQGDWEVIAYTWRQVVHHPDAVLEQVVRAMDTFRARGRR